MFISVICASAGFAFDIGILKYGGGDWYSCLPAVRNFVANYTSRNSGLQINSEPKQFFPDDSGFFTVPFFVMNGHGQLFWSDIQRRKLRLYLDNGGFLFVNDDFGMDSHFRREIKLIYPDSSLKEVAANHPIFRCYYKIKGGLPKIHKHSGGRARAYALYRKGRMVLFYAFNSDIVDGWEKASIHKDPASVREAAFRMGSNILFYAMTR